MNDAQRRHTGAEQPDASHDGHSFGEVFDGLGGDGLRETLREAEPRVREMLASHPVPLLLGAVAVGYLIARLVRGDDS